MLEVNLYSVKVHSTDKMCNGVPPCNDQMLLLYYAQPLIPSLLRVLFMYHKVLIIKLPSVQINGIAKNRKVTNQLLKTFKHIIQGLFWKKRMFCCDKSPQCLPPSCWLLIELCILRVSLAAAAIRYSQLLFIFSTCSTKFTIPPSVRFAALFAFWMQTSLTHPNF